MENLYEYKASFEEYKKQLTELGESLWHPSTGTK